MITSKEVFAKRKEGALDDAYQMALQLTNQSSVDDWDFKALAWCLVDLIKREVNAENQQNLILYRQELESIKTFPADEVLQRGVKNALSLCNPYGQLISQAKALSKENRHEEAARLYRKIWVSGFADRDIQTSLSWELYKISKELIARDNVNPNIIKRNLNDHLKLDVEKPSLLHSCFLQLAAKLAGQDQLNMMAFSRQWNLNYLRPEDFERYYDNNGKHYPSLAEKVIQQASKKATISNSSEYMNYIMPYVDSAIEKCPDNIWLKLNKSKLLLALNKHDDALNFGLEVVKSKVNDYWAWDLLGDIYASTDLSNAFSCYCKALLCPTDDKFTGKVRLKVAQYLVGISEFARAKYEVEKVLSLREKDSQQLSEDVLRIISQAWYVVTQASTSNLDYYKANASLAESLLFSNMQWIPANVGESFTVHSEKGKYKVKRKIFIKTSSEPMEISISESKFIYKELALGAGLQIKGEFDTNKKFQVYVIEKRVSMGLWDVFFEKVGVIDHVNKDKGVAHFILDKNIDGIIPLEKLPKSCQEGDAIAVKLSQYTSKRGNEYHVIHAIKTTQIPSTQIKKQFCEEVRISKGMGFTENDIFISPFLVDKYQITDGQEISGTTVLSYNKKREEWGWKAISIQEVA